MLLKKAEFDAITAGEVTVVFRRWKRPGVKAGGTQRSGWGVVAIDAVDRVEVEDLTEADATAAGFPDRASLVDALAYRDEPLYRVRVRPGPEDPRIALRAQADLTADDVAAITARLERFDRASRRGPWTEATLTMIRDEPGRRAPDLAEQLGWETQPFKTNVRKLKELGLTVSLEVGYRLSPRGEAYLARRAGRT